MNKFTKIGLVVMVIGVLVWGIPFAWLRLPTPNPLFAPFPLAAHTRLEREFTVRTGQLYIVEVGCLGVGPMKDKWDDFSSSTESPIPCDVTVRILKEGAIIHSEHHDALRTTSLSGDRVFLHLAYPNLPSAGHYRLEIANGSDLTHLKVAQPTVEIFLPGKFYVNRAVMDLLGFAAGLLILLIGVGFLVHGILKRSSTPTGD